MCSFYTSEKNFQCHADLQKRHGKDLGKIDSKNLVNQLRMCSSCNQPDIKNDQTLKAFSITRMLGYLLIPFIKIYQYIISPVMGPKCRFVPTCSQYGEQALKKYGLFKGGWLLIKRLSKCRPGGGSGWDPVP
jgi:putative membrane protein insertion efficiency factor